MKCGREFIAAFEAARKTEEYWMTDVELDFLHALAEVIKSKNISMEVLDEMLRKSDHLTLKKMVRLCLAIGSKITIKIEDIEPIEMWDE